MKFINRYLEKKLSLRVFILCLLLGLMVTIFFSWAVQDTLVGSGRSGKLGEIAVTISSFPHLVKSVLKDIFVNTVGDETVFLFAERHIQNIDEFKPIISKSGLVIDGLLVRANKEVMSNSPGWLILVGLFTIDGEQKNAALAISPEFEVKKVWILSESEIDGRVPQGPYRKFVHGFEVLSDASVIFTFDGGISIQRFDKCGSRVWAKGGDFHHSVTLDETRQFIWTLESITPGNESLTKVAVENGEIVQQISIQEIIDSNPMIDILDIHKEDDNDVGGNSRNTTGKWEQDPFHLNDVDPLPSFLASHFDKFVGGDLLVSSRSLNLIFVVDPATLEVKWWRNGIVRRQHDPDWGFGEITVYDNRMSRDFSRIISIDPDSYNTKTIFDGRVNGFYSRIRGKHQFTKDGNLLVTSTGQGRVFEVNSKGEWVLEIINIKSDSEQVNYVVSEAKWFPPDDLLFSEENLKCTN